MGQLYDRRRVITPYLYPHTQGELQMKRNCLLKDICQDYSMYLQLVCLHRTAVEANNYVHETTIIKQTRSRGQSIDIKLNIVFGNLKALYEPIQNRNS